jgi:peptidoglycan hydrolase CwlO-like protein
MQRLHKIVIKMVKYTFLFLTLFSFYNSNSYADVVKVGSFKCEPYTYEPDKSFDLLVVLMQEKLFLTNKLNKLNLKIENLEVEVSNQSCKAENLNEEIKSYKERIISLKEFTSKCTR